MSSGTQTPLLSAQRSEALTFALHSTHAQTETLAAEWSQLLRRSLRSELTQTPEWLLTWWHVFGDAHQRPLRIGSVHDHGRLIGIIPLYQRNHWYRNVLPFRRLEFLGSGEPNEESICTNHLNVIAEKGCEAIVAVRFAKALVEGALGSWDELVLPMMDPDAPLTGLLSAEFRNAGLYVEIQELDSAPWVVLPDQWDTYLKSLAKRHRVKIKSALAKFDAWSQGTMHVEHISTRAELERGKKILVELHEGRWARAGKPGVFRAARFRRFHDRLMEILVEHNALEISILSAHGEPAAAIYNMIWRDKVYSYQCGRRLDLPSHLSPGRVLDALAIQRAIAHGRREFDFLASDARHKRIFANHVRRMVQVRAARTTLRETIRRAGCALLRRLRGNS